MYISIEGCARTLTFIRLGFSWPGFVRPEVGASLPHLPYMEERSLNRGTSLPTLDLEWQAVDRAMDAPKTWIKKKGRRRSWLITFPPTDRKWPAQGLFPRNMELKKGRNVARIGLGDKQLGCVEVRCVSGEGDHPRWKALCNCEIQDPGRSVLRFPEPRRQRTRSPPGRFLPVLVPMMDDIPHKKGKPLMTSVPMFSRVPCSSFPRIYSIGEKQTDQRRSSSGNGDERESEKAKPQSGNLNVLGVDFGWRKDVPYLWRNV